ncbi:hypothetical protein A3Q33_20450 [Colwellia sp. PAMC 21821]|nr:hypothetical protein A3Q33_00855 [Colwellia sp. PAMC 21821]ARD43073.1 hypothetical protein A3Q33_01255 [Colwellia sp. PAMC 21821]ARD43139.1 hypothetical protein A3Q33_01690 [Colwellia sp. PAMC 21821]ARD43288.1 hypothetical protein A3Q33_02545 [Colwellia sp. PAMC 21821]ARD43331.1 hypothetical protein A3Q33_02780 [Colwellia sp. PAMC 21821]
MANKKAGGMMRSVSANNHRGQKVKILHKQAGYMRAMIFSYITIKCLANGVGPYMQVLMFSLEQ